MEWRGQVYNTISRRKATYVYQSIACVLRIQSSGQMWWFLFGVLMVKLGINGVCSPAVCGISDPQYHGIVKLWNPSTLVLHGSSNAVLQHWGSLFSAIHFSLVFFLFLRHTIPTLPQLA
ncbi:hypothetical protein BU16DRAFT_174579 [Lophium mytilinum]|uniref:Uncharacterized protein n=1 Tax=Lophium mytilinum TaxID=390894 RepID=A0A6A6QAN5_9PEZI|nr:hypothetical protein BU16DRAFT_174579 [Lophium mytilinum]